MNIDLLPKDPRHQRFADGLLAGMRPSAAYMAAYPGSKKTSANPGAARLKRRADVKAYMQAIQLAAAKESHLSLEEKRDFCARVVRCRIDQEPDDSDLWQELRTTETETSSTTIRKLPGKLESIKLDNEMAGTDAQANALDELARALANLPRQ